jgi:hypothetical protein
LRIALAAALLLLLAAGLRFWVLRQAHFVLDGDEAVTGIMARHLFTHGERAIFFYGQPYMAPTDAWIAAPFLALGGGSGWVKAGPFLWSVALVALNGILARRLFHSTRAGWLAMLITALPPLYFLVNGLRALGSFGLTLILGNLLLLLAHRLVFDPRPLTPRRERLLWGALGLLTGFGFYAFWLVGFYCVPVFFYLFLKDKTFFKRRTFALFVLGFILGSLPFWGYNLAHQGATFHYFFDPHPEAERVPLGEVSDFFYRESLPLVIGAQNPWFPTSARLSRALVVIWSALGGGWLLARRRGWPNWFRLSLRHAAPVDMLLLFGITSAVIFMLAVGQNAFALPGLLGRLAALAILGALLLGNLWPYQHADFVAVFQSPYYAQLRPPVDNQPAIDYLRSQGIEYATCNHWVGNRLMLDAEETVKCVDFYDIVQGGADRFPAYTRIIQEPGRRVGFVLVNPAAQPTPLEARLRELDVAFTRRDMLPMRSWRRWDTRTNVVQSKKMTNEEMINDKGE